MNTKTRMTTSLCCILVLFAFDRMSPAVEDAADSTGTASAVAANDTETGEFEFDFQSFVKTHCHDCHAGGNTEGDVDLSSSSLADLKKHPRLVRNLIHVLDTREMPPADEPQPSSELRQQIISRLRPVLQNAVTSGTAHVRTPIRRLNRFQYNNAVTDLFELNCVVFTLPERALRVHKNYFQPTSGKMPHKVSVGNRPLGKSQLIEPRLAGVAAFPQDLRAEHGYDNRGDHLSLSPLLMDQFLKLGESITQSPDFDSKRVGIWDRFFADPSDDADLSDVVGERIRPFLTRAFRRPVTTEVVNRYAQFVISKIHAGLRFEDAMKSVAAATISSPRFLYLYDRQTSETELTDTQEVDDYELASRMSFFLWGSGPDETLLELAATNKLRDTQELSLQVDRLLQDPKLKRFCDSFPIQWLQLDRIVSSLPDRRVFPDFYYSKYRTSMHMMLEPLLLFETVLIEDRPIHQLIDSDFTYRSAKLDFAYGKLTGGTPSTVGGGVGVLTFRRVATADRRTGGVITNAAVMTMTSAPNRTQPITRGAWIASVIFNDPPDPPPADVPALPEPSTNEEHQLTLRQRLAAHRQRADCRGCHEQIDPLGFALENYDPVGRWRREYENGTPIDVSGELFREHAFSSVVEFKDAILADKDRICRAFAGHLLSFALARDLGPADQVAIEEVAKRAAANDYKMKSLIREIILSKPFRTK